MDGLQILTEQFGRERTQIARRHARHPEGLPEVERAALVKQLQGQMTLWAEAGGDEKAFPLAPELEKLMASPDNGADTSGEPEASAPDTADGPDSSALAAPDAEDDSPEEPQDTDAGSKGGDKGGKR